MTNFFRDYHVKEKPLFTGISRGFGGFSFGAGAGLLSPSINSFTIAYDNITGSRFTSETFSMNLDSTAFDTQKIKITFGGGNTFPVEYYYTNQISSLVGSTFTLSDSDNLDGFSNGDEILQNNSSLYHNGYTSWYTTKSWSGKVRTIIDNYGTGGGVFLIDGGGYASSRIATYTTNFKDYVKLINTGTNTQRFAGILSSGRKMLFDASNLYYSDSDLGPNMSWTTVSHGIPGSSQNVFDFDGTTFYASTTESSETRIYKSTNGTSWTLQGTVNAGQTFGVGKIKGHSVTGEYYASRNTGSSSSTQTTLYHSTDYGVSWTSKGTTTGFQRGNFCKNNSTGYYYAVQSINYYNPDVAQAYGYRLVRSTNTMSSWSGAIQTYNVPEGPRLNPGAESTDFVFRTYHPGQIYISTNNGANFSSVTTGISGARYDDVWSENLNIYGVASAGNSAWSSMEQTGAFEPRATVDSVSTSNNTITISSSTTTNQSFTTGAGTYLELKTGKNPTYLYGVVGSDGTLSDKSTIPKFYEIDSDVQTITFPATFDSYSYDAPDSDIPANNSITVDIILENILGSATETSNSITPTS